MKKLFKFSDYFKPSSFFYLILIIVASCSQDVIETSTDENLALTFSSSSELTSITSSAKTIQAENYDGMSGIRTGTTNDNGLSGFVGWVETGDFVEYDINISNAGSYKFDFRISSMSNGAKFDFYQGNTKLSNVNKAATGDWNTYITTSKTVNLSAGNSTIKILATGSSWNINWLKITPVNVDNNNNNGGTTNLALGKSATQSTTAHNGVASRAVDGNTSGVWNEGSVTHTNNSLSPWWQVQLGTNYAIGEIVVWNRTNCCSSRLSNFDVFVYNSSDVQVYKTTITSTPSPSVSINTGGVTGSRVRIKLKGTNPLSLAEVQVFAGSNDGNNGGGTTTDGEFTLNNIQIETASCSQSDSDDSTDSEDATNSSYQNTSYYTKSGSTYKLTSCADKGKRTEWKQKSGQEAPLTTSRTMIYTASVKDIPNDGVTIAQLHNRGGAGRPIIRIEVNANNKIEFVNAESPVKETQRYRKTEDNGPTYTEGTDLDVQISVSNNSVTCTVVTTSGSITRTYSKGNSNGDLKLYDAWFNDSSIRDSFYFKAGVYNDSGNGSDKPNSTFKSFVIN